MVATKISLDARDWMIVAMVTVAGTIFCMLATLVLDYPNFVLLSEEARVRSIRNDIMIPLVLSVPFFTFLMWKIRLLEKAKTKLEFLATTDNLTNVLNRGAFRAEVCRSLEEPGGRRKGSSALLVIDVDHFKRVNDWFGHDCGDQALCDITVAIATALRENDLVGRIGGEEFGVFIPLIDRITARIVADRICRAVAQVDFRPNGEAHPLSVSIGIAMSNGATSITTLFKAADNALYEAKKSGRNRVVEHAIPFQAA